MWYIRAGSLHVINAAPTVTVSHRRATTVPPPCPVIMLRDEHRATVHAGHVIAGTVSSY